MPKGVYLPKYYCFLHAQILLINCSVLCYATDYFAKISLLICFINWANGFHIDSQVLVVFPAVIFRATWIRLFPVVHAQYVLVCKLLDNLSQSIQVCIVALPLIIVFDMDYFSLDITTMNGSLGYIQAIQAIHKDTRHAFGKTNLAHFFQLW